MMKTDFEADLSVRSRASVDAGGAAFERLLSFAEKSDKSLYAPKVATFIAATVGFCRFDMYDLQVVSVSLSDDMLACLDTIRWQKGQLQDMVVDGWIRSGIVCKRFGYITSDC